MLYGSRPMQVVSLRVRRLRPAETPPNDGYLSSLSNGRLSFISARTYDRGMNMKLIGN